MDTDVDADANAVIGMDDNDPDMSAAIHTFVHTFADAEIVSGADTLESAFVLTSASAAAATNISILM